MEHHEAPASGGVLHRLRLPLEQLKIEPDADACRLRQIILQQLHIQRRGHDDEIQVGPVLLLQFERARQRDVAVKMPFMKFVEDED